MRFINGGGDKNVPIFLKEKSLEKWSASAANFFSAENLFKLLWKLNDGTKQARKKVSIFLDIRPTII